MVFTDRSRVKGELLDKTRPVRQKLLSIIRIQIKTIDTNVGKLRWGEGAFSLSFTHRGIGDFWRKSGENTQGARTPIGYLWKRIADQVARNSLEWPPRGNS